MFTLPSLITCLPLLIVVTLIYTLPSVTSAFFFTKQSNDSSLLHVFSDPFHPALKHTQLNLSQLEHPDDISSLPPLLVSGLSFIPPDHQLQPHNSPPTQLNHPVSEHQQQKQIQSTSSTASAPVSAVAALLQPSPSPVHHHRQKPFSVSIEDVRYYGGLITYSHHLHPARICRVLNACIRPDNTLVLPAWMQRHDDSLSFHCGHPRLDFSLPDTIPPPPVVNLDLIGLHVPRPSMPDFLTDFIPNAVVFDLIYGDHNATKACHSRKGNDCAPFPGLAEGLRAAVILPSRLRRLEERKSWPRQFVKLMKPNSVGRKIRFLYEDAFHDSLNKLTCFRSALFTRGPFNKNTIMADHMRSISFMTSHGIFKRAHLLDGPGIGANGVGDCAVNITLSNRKLVDGAHNRLIGRYMLNLADLRDAIMQQALRVPRLRLRVSMMTLEGRGLRWQVNAMQKTDIWVAGHGPLLTNMVFLRENSTLIEVQPFTYYSHTYENMAARLAHVSYDRYIAHPDLTGFETCMRQLFPSSHHAHKRAMHYLDRYRDASEKFFKSDATHSLVLNTLEEADMHHVRTCALMQRLDTNAKNFAIAIVRQARLRCGLPQPELRSART